MPSIHFVTTNTEKYYRTNLKIDVKEMNIITLPNSLKRIFDTKQQPAEVFAPLMPALVELIKINYIYIFSFSQSSSMNLILHGYLNLKS